LRTATAPVATVRPSRPPVTSAVTAKQKPAEEPVARRRAAGAGDADWKQF